MTLINTVPSAMAELLGMGAVPASARVVNLAGEPLRAPLVQALERLGSVEAVYNLYGPTEDTTYSTFARVDGRGGEAPSIGRPIAGSRAYLLDGRLAAVPAGVPGELFLAGAGLARGYHGRPDATADRFVPDPFAAEPGARLYRTGDLCRRRPTGDLDFLGRLDHQVKVRGFRIELGEIEALLGAQPDVREAVILLREDGPPGPRLVAYAAAEEGRTLTAGALRAGLAEKLPAHMVPASFCPASPPCRGPPTAKCSTAGCFRRPGRRRGKAAARAAPRTPVEELLAAIWAAVLGVGHVGADDRFFDLGGALLLATQVISRVRRAFGVDLPLRELFQHPTVAGLARRVEAARGGAAARRRRSWPERRAGRDLPLSFAQQRLWFLDRLQPESAAYNLPASLRLTGPLDVAALHGAFVAIVGRHEALRTRFPAAGKPVQRIEPAARVELPLVDLGGLAPGAREEEAARLSREEARRPFSLAKGPLLRLLLVRCGAGEHDLLATLHHIVSDAWSLGVLLREVAAFYGALPAGVSSGLPDLPVQYADFTIWQIRRLSAGALAERLAFWTARLAEAPVLALPTDRPRPPVQSFRGAMESVPLRPAGDGALDRLAARRTATPFLVLLAAWSALLARYSGQDDVVVGVPVAGRDRVETEPLIGFFVNTLALRCEAAPAATFGGLLEGVREAWLEASAHQDLPFEKIVEQLRPGRSLSHAPLFQVMLAFEAAPARPVELRGLTTRRIEPGTGTAKFDLTLYARAGEDGLQASLEYALDLFDRPTAVRLLRHLTTLLAAAVDGPESRLADLPLLEAGERHQLLMGWNAGPAAGAPAVAVHERFAAQAAAWPDREAVVCDGRSWSYGELDRRSNALAWRLRHLGAGPERLVAVCAERCLELVAALLAVLKAGAAYVPLDPAYPRERLAFMLEDAGAPVLITQSRLLEALPPHRSPVLLLEEEEIPAGPLATPPAAAVGPDSLAYVIYTSGSTGRPKGVGMRHGGVAALIDWSAGVFPPEDLEGVLAATSICFDLSVFELFVPLSLGGRVILVRDAMGLRGLAADAGVTLVNTVPSAMAELLRSGALPPSVRTVNLAGEALPRHPGRRGLRHRRGEALQPLRAGRGHHLQHRRAPVPAAGTPGLPTSIGRPIDGTRAFLVDRGGRPQRQSASSASCELGGEGARRVAISAGPR